MLIPVEAVREAIYKVRIDAEIELTIKFIVFLDALLERPMSKIRVLWLTVRSDWNVGVCVPELDEAVGDIRRGRCLLGKGRSRQRDGC
jgi:hypothetical protein